MARGRSASNDRGSALERVVAEHLEALHAKLGELVEIVPQHSVTLGSGRKAIVDFRLTVHFSHEIQNYYIEVQSRRKHDHDLIDKIEAVRRDTQLKTFRFVHDTPLEASVAKELKSRGVICYDLNGFDMFLKGLELNLSAVVRLQEQVDRGDSSVADRLKSLVTDIAAADKDIAHMLPVANSERDRLVKDAIKIAINNPDVVKKLLGDFLRGR
jgi:hypothetical protein